MKVERTAFFVMGTLSFFVSFVVAMIIAPSPTLPGTWVMLVLIGLGTASVGAGLVRLAMEELAEESSRPPLSVKPANDS